MSPARSAARGVRPPALGALTLAAALAKVGAVALQPRQLSDLAANATDVTVSAALRDEVKKRPLPHHKRSSGVLDVSGVDRKHGKTCDTGTGKPCPTLHSTWLGACLFVLFFCLWSWLTGRGKAAAAPSWHAEARLAVSGCGGEPLRCPLRVAAVSWNLAGPDSTASLEGAQRLLAECLEPCHSREVPTSGGGSTTGGEVEVCAVCLQECSQAAFCEVERAVQQLLGDAFHLVLRARAPADQAGLGVLVFAADSVRATPLEGGDADAEGLKLSFVSVDVSKHPRGAPLGDPTEELLKCLRPGADGLGLLAALGETGASGSQSDGSSPVAGAGTGLLGEGGRLLFRAGPGAVAALRGLAECGGQAEAAPSWQGRHLPVRALFEIGQAAGVA